VRLVGYLTELVTVLLVFYILHKIWFSKSSQFLITD